MSTTVLPASRAGLFSANHLARLPENDHYELIEGVLIEMAPPGAEHGNVTALLVVLTGAFILEHDLGTIFTSETGFLVARDPDTVLAPDFAFVARERLPATLPRTYLPIVPDLVLETRSPSDTKGGVAAKVARWLSLGVRLVWELDPAARVLIVAALRRWRWELRRHWMVPTCCRDLCLLSGDYFPFHDRQTKAPG